MVSEYILEDSSGATFFTEFGSQIGQVDFGYGWVWLDQVDQVVWIAKDMYIKKNSAPLECKFA